MRASWPWNGIDMPAIRFKGTAKNIFLNVRQSFHFKKIVKEHSLDVRACSKIYFGHAFRCENIFLGMPL
jgi:hypothetical protein